MSLSEKGPLAPYRILDLTDELGFLCGKTLGDLGADVIKVERPGGDAARQIGPYLDGERDPEKSLYWFAFNNNKRGITLDLEAPEGQVLFKRLAAKADFVLETFRPGYLEGIGLGHDVIRAANPHTVLVSITPFGLTGPYSRYRATDIEIMAMSGCMSLTGDPDKPPLRVTFPQSYQWTGSYAAMAALVAHTQRRRTGRGEHVDVSAQACMLWGFSHAHTFWDLNRSVEKRAGSFMTGRTITGAKMRVFWPCKDGYLNFIIYGGEAGRKTNQALVEWMAEKGAAPAFLLEKDWRTFNIEQVTQDELDVMEEPIAEFFTGVTKAEFFEAVTGRGMLGYPVSTAQELLADPQLKARDFWQEVEHPELNRTITYPGGFARFSDFPCRIYRRAPLIGEHNREVYTELGLEAGELVRLENEGVI
ncbi:MAG: CoA transferase [Deltaproteobacteria bacterium]|nr:CoA transferase [Deltaproteobacteria bacterium]